MIDPFSILVTDCVHPVLSHTFNVSYYPTARCIPLGLNFNAVSIKLCGIDDYINLCYVSHTLNTLSSALDANRLYVLL